MAKLCFAPTSEPEMSRAICRMAGFTLSSLQSMAYPWPRRVKAFECLEGEALGVQLSHHALGEPALGLRKRAVQEEHHGELLQDAAHDVDHGHQVLPPSAARTANAWA